MKKILLTTILTFVLSCVSYAQEADLKVTVKPDTSYHSVGDEFYVDFDVTQNSEGYNSVNALVEYDTSVIQAVKSEVSEEAEDVIVYTSPSGQQAKLFTVPFINSRINFTPVAGDPDYDGVPDGNTNCSKLGRIVLASFLNKSVDGVLQSFTGTGNMFRMKFKVVGEGTSDIKLTLSGVTHFVYENNKANDIENVVSVTNGFVTTDPEPENKVLKGDVNSDNIVNRADYAHAAKYFSGHSVEINNDNTDVNSDSKVNRQDYMILSKYFAGIITEF